MSSLWLGEGQALTIWDGNGKGRCSSDVTCFNNLDENVVGTVSPLVDDTKIGDLVGSEEGYLTGSRTTVKVGQGIAGGIYADSWPNAKICNFRWEVCLADI